MLATLGFNKDIGGFQRFALLRVALVSLGMVGFTVLTGAITLN